MLLSILVIIWALIFLIPLTYCTKRMSWSRNLMYCWSLLQLLIQQWNHAYCNLTVYLCMAAHYGTYLVPPFIPLKSSSTTFSGVSGTYPAPATLASFTITARLPSILNSVALRSASLLASVLSCSSAVFCTVFQSSSTLAYTPTGYNALFGEDHIKYYCSHDGICASVSGTFDQYIINDMIYAISTC